MLSFLSNVAFINVISIDLSCFFTGMVYLHQQDIIHRDLKSSNGKQFVAMLTSRFYGEYVDTNIIDSRLYM